MINWPQGDIGSGNGLATSRRQAITRTNVDPVYSRIYAVLVGDEFKYIPYLCSRSTLWFVLLWFAAYFRITSLALGQQIISGARTNIAHYDDVIMGTIASQITSLTSVYSTVYSGADQSKHQSSASLAFVWGIHRGPVNSPHKWPVTRKMFPFDDVIMLIMHVNPTRSTI